MIFNFCLLKAWILRFTFLVHQQSELYSPVLLFGGLSMLVKGFLPDVSDGAKGGELYEQVLGPRWWSQLLRLHSSAAPTGGLEGMQTGMK